MPHRSVPYERVSYKGARFKRFSLQRCQVYLKRVQGLLGHVSDIP